jgi:DNA polymerase-1
MDGKMPNFSLKKWRGIVDGFLGKYQGLDQWQKDNIEIVERQGYLVQPTGRILTFHPNPEGFYSETQIKNYPVQSLATADIMKLAMVVIAKRMRDQGFRSLIIFQVHDSIVLDVIKEELHDLACLCVQTFNELPDLIERTWGFEFNLPLTGDAECGPNYCDTEKMELDLAA